MKLVLCQILMVGLLVSCLDTSDTRSTRSTKNNSEGNGTEYPSVTPTATPGPAPILPPAAVDLRGIVDPVDNITKGKVTIPKNYSGWLYLYAVNVDSLKSKFIYVRFNFGKDRTPVTLPAVIGIPVGTVPAIDVDMLMIDLRLTPFNDIRNLYQLYDYGDYDSDNDGLEELAPASDELDTNLYCRGLDLSSDPTFNDSDSNGMCDSVNDKCLYSYASLGDQSLSSRRVNAPAIDFGEVIPFRPVEGKIIDRVACLPDSNYSSMLVTALGGSSNVSGSFGTYLYGGESVVVDGVVGTSTYNGPYRKFDDPLAWKIKGDAIFSSNGLFKAMFPSGDNGFKSMLFPRAGKMNLKDGISYLGSTTPFGQRVLMETSGGTSNYVDGCNIRALNSPGETDKTLGSCNVTATIEILERVDGSFKTISEITGLKLQLTRESKKNGDGVELFVESMKTCHSERECGSSECCYAGHCMSNDIVPTCTENTTPTGNQGIGESCGSDGDCVSLCCNDSTKSCDVHLVWDDGSITPRTCSKAPGQSCIASGWCKEENISKCMIVKTGIDPETSRITCALRCYNIPTHGTCENNSCRPPAPYPVPEFNPANPDCSTAVNPPTIL